MTEQAHVTIYTDGGADPNPGPGGWAALLIADGGTAKPLSGAVPETTNNRMELTAALEALRALKGPCRVTLYTDSVYLQRGISEWLPTWIARGWTRKGDRPIENLDLWQALQTEAQRHDIDWHWVKGHAGNAHNERVDRMATGARVALTGAPDPGELSHAAYTVVLRVSVPQTGGTVGYAFRVVPPEDAPAVLQSGAAPATTSNRLILVAASDALRQIPEGAPVRLFCPDDYLHKGMTQWVAGWERRGWQTREGAPVKNQAEWRVLTAEAAIRSVTWLPREAEDPALSADLETLAAQAARGAGPG